jgi:putative nucleotidyltransferase with HDIG domain
MHPKLKRYISTVGDLPSVPALASEVMKLVESPNASGEDLRRVIDKDPAVAARILKVANSSLYGFSRAIETLSHAIALLGFRTVRNLVMAASLRQTFKHFGLTEKLLWEHATLAGVVAMRLASHPSIKHDAEEAFTAGLLHDLGKIAFNNSSREQYGKVVARVYNEGLSFVAAEREEFGFDHAELGACVADKWRLAESLVTAIRYHHSPEALEKLEGKQRRLTALTTVTTASCTRLGVGRRTPVEGLVLHALPAWGALGLREDHEDEILTLVETQVRQAGDLVS